MCAEVRDWVVAYFHGFFGQGDEGGKKAVSE